MSTLAELLSPQPEVTTATEKPEPAPAAEAVEEGEEQAVEAQASEQPGEKKEAPPASGEARKTETEHVPMAVVIAERKARQEAERRLQELESRQAAPKREEPKKTGFWDDPEKALAERDAAVEDRIWAERCNISEELMKEKVGAEKYDAACQAFEAAVAENPALATALRRAPNPARFAFEEGNKALFYRKVGSDPSAYEKQIADQAVAEYIANQKKPAEADEAEEREARPRPPISLATRKSNGGASPSSWTGPEPLEDLLRPPT